MAVLPHFHVQPLGHFRLFRREQVRVAQGDFYTLVADALGYRNGREAKLNEVRNVRVAQKILTLGFFQ
jgi:hypothetical protein